MTTFIEASPIVKNYKYSENSFLPHIVTIPLSHEHNITCKPMVNPGDTVKEGDIIAINSETNSVIHSSVPGKVLEIIPTIMPNGKKDYSIKIQTGGKFTYLGRNIPEKDISFLSDLSILKSFKEKGLINTFEVSKPVSVYNEINALKNPEYLIVRLFDEDNFRYTDSLITKFYLDEVLKGASVISKAIHAKGILLAINTKTENLEEFKNLQNDTIKIVEMNIKRYPSGTKREIMSAYNRNVRKIHNFNITKNDYFIDASTAYEAYKCIYKDIPSVSKLVFFNGNCLNASGLLNVRIGTKVSDLISQLGGFIKNPGLILVNGMIVGNSVPSVDISITKYVKSITINSKNKITDKQIHSCVNCGSCRFICPVNISPDLLYNNLSKFRPLPDTIRNTALACTNCGLCNIVCPSRLPLCQTINILKENALSDKAVKKEATDENK